MAARVRIQNKTTGEKRIVYSVEAREWTSPVEKNGKYVPSDWVVIAIEERRPPREASEKKPLTWQTIDGAIPVKSGALPTDPMTQEPPGDSEEGKPGAGRETRGGKTT